MGFGIALLGYACLMLHEIGGGIFAAPILAYGFFLASRLNKTFMNAAVSALFILPRGIVQFCSVINLIDLNELVTLNVITFMLFILAWLLTVFFWLKAVMEIARECNSPKLENQARVRLIITVSFLMLTAAVALMNMYGMFGVYGATVNAGLYIAQYVIIFINLFFMHTCFVLITSERQYAKDKQQLAMERAKALEKKHKEQQEASSRIDRRK